MTTNPNLGGAKPRPRLIKLEIPDEGPPEDLALYYRDKMQKMTAAIFKHLNQMFKELVKDINRIINEVEKTEVKLDQKPKII